MDDFLNIPPKTKVDHLFWKFYAIRNTNRVFLGHWEVSILPILCEFSIHFLCFFFFYLDILPLLQHSSVQLTTSIIFLTLSCISFFLIIYEGPGFLPYYEGGKDILPWDFFNDDVPATYVLTNKKQKKFLQEYPLKEDRVFFIQKEKRYVIRPTFIFPQGNTTIGKNNEKFYMLYQLYLTIYYYIITFCSISSFEFENFKYGFDFHVIRMSILLITSLISFSRYLINLFVDFKYAMFNIIPSELVDKNFNHTRSIKMNLQKVYGKLSLLLLPIPSR